MSYEGYFESIIKTWRTAEKRTPTMVKDMKEVLRQFDASLQYNEIPEDKIPYLKSQFKEIHEEVYK